ILCSAKTVTDSFSIRNIGCDSLQIQSINLEVDQDPKADFTFAKVHSFALSSLAPARTFYISYKPTTVGQATARLILITSVAIDTINLQGEGLRDRHAVSFMPDTLRAKVGDMGVGYLPISNLGCRLTDLDSIQTQSPLFFPPGQFYLPLGSGEIESIKVLFSPQKIGLSTISIHLFLRVLSEADTISYDTILSVSIEGLSGNQSSVLPEHSISPGKEILIRSLYPNPASGEITIDLQSTIQAVAHIEIINTLGMIVYSDVRHLMSGPNRINLSIDKLPEGAYQLKILTGKGEVSESFLRIR
ncbi:MAG: T9SS type A sorting domain-containing protein, partial [Candidatus Kapaibacterium sp.]